MMSQNEEAEELMRKIEREEERVTYEDGTKRIYHLCIVNLVIGTLYCSKGNYEFGISRIVKSLEPYDKKLSIDTWYYVKRCFLSLFEMTAKHMMVMKDSFYEECMDFLEQVIQHGREVITLIPQADGVVKVDPSVHNVSYEARILKTIMYQLR